MLPDCPDTAPVRLADMTKKRSRGDPAQVMFWEFFAGQGVLSAAVARLGIHTEPPDEWKNGGTDFRKNGRWKRSRRR